MPRRARLALGIALVVVVCAVVLSRLGDDVGAEEGMRTCRLADRLRVAGQPDEAAKLYRQVLASPVARSRPGEQGCAADGLHLLADAQCAEGRQLAQLNLAAEAKASFTTLLSATTATADRVDHDCAIDGLAALARQHPAPAAAPATPTTAPAPPRASAGASPSGAPGSAAPPTPSLGRPGLLTLVADGAQRGVRDVLQPLTGRKLNVKGSDWAALALVVLVLALALQARRRQCLLGPLDVRPLDTAVASSLLPAELVARMTDHLTELGARPPAAVPSGPAGAAALEVLGTSPLPQAAWLAKVGMFLLHLVAPPPPAGTLSGTVRDDGLTMELSVERQSPAVRTFRAPHIEAARSAAGFAYANFIRDRDRRCTPTWERWTSTDGSSVAHYLAGLDLEAAAGVEGDAPSANVLRREAMQHYRLAAAAEPENLELQLRMANLWELKGCWAKAVKIYLDQVEWMEVRRQPHLFDPSYRLGIALTFAVQLVNQLEGDAVLAGRLCRRGIALRDDQKDKWVRQLLDGAIVELRKLREQSGFRPAVGDWLHSFQPRSRPYCRRRELAELARPLSQRRRRRCNVVDMAILCAEFNMQALNKQGTP